MFFLPNRNEKPVDSAVGKFKPSQLLHGSSEKSIHLSKSETSLIFCLELLTCIIATPFPSCDCGDPFTKFRLDITCQNVWMVSDRNDVQGTF